jgi:hypothetical protein
MDDSEHTRPLAAGGGGDDEWLASVRRALADARARPGSPVLDIEWLLTRCDDTARMSGPLRDASLTQLRQDLRDFEEEFPRVLPPRVLDES